MEIDDTHKSKLFFPLIFGSITMFYVKYDGSSALYIIIYHVTNKLLTVNRNKLNTHTVLYINDHVCALIII